MLLWIEGDPSDWPSFAGSETNRRAISNLLHAGREGRHAVFGSRDLLIAMERSAVFSDLDSAYLAFAAGRLTQDGMWMADAPKVRVAIDSEIVEQQADGWRVPLDFFLNADRLDVPALLCENIRDAMFYRQHAVWAVDSGLHGYRVKLELLHGGGDQTAEMFTHYLTDTSRAIVCVADSDRSEPAANLGLVASRCQAATRAAVGSEFRVALHVLDARSLENLISDSLWEILLVGMEEQHRLSWDLIRGLPEELRRFINLRSGDTLCRFPTEDLDVRSRAGMEGVRCPQCGRQPACIEIAPFGKRTLARRAVASMDGVDERGRVPANWPRALRQVANDLANVGLALPPMRV